MNAEDSVDEHRDGAGQEQDRADADGEVPEPLPLARQLHAHVDHREADAVEGVEDDGAEQGDFAELEQRRAECFQGRVELFGVLQVADRVHVDDEVADQRDAGEALDPEGEVADVAPGVLARGEGERVAAEYWCSTSECSCHWLLVVKLLGEQQRPLHLHDRIGEVDAFGAGGDAVELGVAAPDAVVVVEDFEAVVDVAVAGVEQAEHGLVDGGRAEVSLVAAGDAADAVAGAAGDAVAF